MIRPSSIENRREVLACWLLVALPATAGFLVFFLLERPPHHTVAEAVGEGLFWALATTLLIESLGYGIVREVRTGGKDTLTWRVKALLGGGLFALGVGVSIVFGWTHLYDHPAVYALIFLTVGTAGFVAYRGGSMVLTIGVATCTPLALFGYVGALRWTGHLRPQAIPWGAPIYTLVVGCLLGVTAYLLGGGYRRFGSRAAS